MTRLRPIFTLALCSLAIPCLLRAQPQQEWVIEALTDQGWTEYIDQTHTWRGTNGVFFKFGGAVGTADAVTLDIITGDAVADGKVRIQHEDQIWAGEHLRYNFMTHQLEAEQFRTGRSPVFASGEGLHAEVTNHVYAATNAFVTTDDVAEPAMKVRAKYIKIIPGKKIEARNATLWVEGVPVFYFPFYSRSLGPHANNFNFIPGYRSAFGPFLMGSYTYFFNDQLDAVLHLDYRERRGVGLGPGFNYHLGPWGDGTIQYYYLHDIEPSLSGSSFPTPQNRQWVYFTYQASPGTNLEVKSRVSYQSDPDVIREFFEREYRQTVQESSFLEVRKFWRNFSLDTYVQPRINDFYDTIVRLPDVRLTGYRQQLGESPLFYESESSAGYYRHLFAVTNGPPLGLDYSAARADTYHQLVLPETFFGWLNLTPRVGGRFSYYSRATGPGAVTDEVYRGVFNTGAELSFKASRVWPAIQNQLLDVNGLRHIIEPSVNYVFVPAPNVRGTNQLPQFDTELPSLRLLPIEYPDYNSIDSIDSQNVLRFGLRNKLQTKRQGQSDDLLNWELVTDWRLRPNPGQSTFADVYSDLDFKPRSWLRLGSQTRFDIETRRFRLAFHSLTLQPNNIWSWTLGHWYVAQLPDGPGLAPTPQDANNLFTSSLFYRVNENWGFRALHRFEARDGRLEEQDYTVYRDMRSWTAALTFRLRYNQTGPEDFGVAFTFSLKAAPRFGLGSDSSRPYSLLGG